MDPTTVLLSALSLGSRALHLTADEAIKDGYAGLKGLIIRKFAQANPDLEGALTKLEKNPEAYKPVVEAEVKAAKVDQDQEVVDRATTFLLQAEATLPGVTGGLVGQINAQRGVVFIARQTGSSVVGGGVIGISFAASGLPGEVDFAASDLPGTENMEDDLPPRPKKS